MTPESGVQRKGWDSTVEKTFPHKSQTSYDWVSDEHIEFMVIYVMTK